MSRCWLLLKCVGCIEKERRASLFHCRSRRRLNHKGSDERLALNPCIPSEIRLLRNTNMFPLPTNSGNCRPLKVFQGNTITVAQGWCHSKESSLAHIDHAFLAINSGPMLYMYHGVAARVVHVCIVPFITVGCSRSLSLSRRK